MSPPKTAQVIDIPFGLSTRVGKGNHVLDGGRHLPMIMGNSEGKGALHYKVYEESAVICAKRLNQLRSAGMEQRNHVLDGGPDTPLERAI